MTRPIVPQNVDDNELKEKILPEVYQWALGNGLLMYPPDFKLNTANIAPFTLYPTPISRGSFEEALDVQKGFNELYAEISRDSGKNGAWLTRETEKLSESDADFTGKLWKLYKSVRDEGILQKLRLGVFRSDYLVDKNLDQIKQVEFNTVSVSFAGFSTKVGEIHKYLNDFGVYGAACYDDKDIPVPTSVPEITQSFADALKKYDSIEKNPVILMVVQRGERNVFDQRALEYALMKEHGIKVVRMTFDEITEKLSIDEDNKRRLSIKSTNEEVAIVYYRTGYTTSDYETDKDWEARKFLERSYAIKAPDLLIQLSGAKKIQQLLTDNQILSKFIEDTTTREKLSKTFVKIFPLDDSELGKIGKDLAMNNPEKYVLKPQREGGGNNIYKEDIPSYLKSLDESEWNAYILMEIIEPEPYTKNIIFRGDDFFRESIISELGIYGTILFDEEKTYFNRNSGWLLRSKFTTSNEGGVAAGFGCLDSVVLY
ncbi:glutathione synthase [Nakaseomyces bracarensis]|uniref:glutathione synthase n=1 Tax=Nakaseomyces bracarensis TaxID=273131 RepID=UPI0038721E50